MEKDNDIFEKSPFSFPGSTLPAPLTKSRNELDVGTLTKHGVIASFIDYHITDYSHGGSL